MNNDHFLLIAVVLALAITGCSTVRTGANDIKAKAVEPAADTGFIQHPELQAKRTDLPFQKVWIKPGFDKSGYRELIVAPVNTDYMQNMDWMHSISSANILGNVKNDTKELAQYFRNQVIKKFREDAKHRFTVIEYAQQHRYPALRLEIALVEVDPSQVVLHAMSWVGPPGTGTLAGAINQRRAAFEAHLRDVQIGEVVATFADRDMQDAGPLNLTRLTWYGPVKGIIDRWSEQFVQIANRKPGEIVSDPVPFTVRPF
jgi:Protein of unknown function (DUF3313)